MCASAFIKWRTHKRWIMSEGKIEWAHNYLYRYNLRFVSTCFYCCDWILLFWSSAKSHTHTHTHHSYPHTHIHIPMNCYEFGISVIKKVINTDPLKQRIQKLLPNKLIRIWSSLHSHWRQKSFVSSTCLQFVWRIQTAIEYWSAFLWIN